MIVLVSAIFVIGTNVASMFYETSSLDWGGGAAAAHASA